MTLSISLFTWNRLDYAKRTITALGENLRVDEDVHFHIADDGSPPGYVEELRGVASRFWDNITSSNTRRRGYGASFNASTLFTHERSDVILNLEDDWELCREFNPAPILAVLRSGLFGCVRVNYIGWTNDLLCRFVISPDGLKWLELLPDSPETHVFSGGPRFAHCDWERRVGLWPEGLPAGVTELEVAGRPEARRGVAWPVDLVKPSGDLFQHIGTIMVKDAPLNAGELVA